jgi:dUTP pyrophosphatase
MGKKKGKDAGVLIEDECLGKYYITIDVATGYASACQKSDSTYNPPALGYYKDVTGALKKIAHQLVLDELSGTISTINSYVERCEACFRSICATLNLQSTPIQVPVLTQDIQLLPQYATPGSSGMDVRLANDQAIESKQCVCVDINLPEIAIPLGYEFQVRSKSGLALNRGIVVFNSPGTVDSDYRGKPGVLLFNSTNVAVHLHKGDRVAQIVLAKIEQVEWVCVTQLPTTQRGSGGFGSTGIK